MLPGRVRQNIPLLAEPAFYSAAAHLRNELLLWRIRHVRAITFDVRQRFEGLEPRINQAAIALLAAAPNATLREVILERLREHSAEMRGERTSSLPGLVAEAIVKRWLRTPLAEADGSRRFLLKEVTEELQHDDRTITAEKVSAAVRGPLGFKTDRRAGNAWLQIKADEIGQLAARYGIEIPRTPI
jgi:hypothetical protein